VVWFGQGTAATSGNWNVRALRIAYSALDPYPLANRLVIGPGGGGGGGNSNYDNTVLGEGGTPTGGTGLTGDGGHPGGHGGTQSAGGATGGNGTAGALGIGGNGGGGSGRDGGGGGGGYYGGGGADGGGGAGQSGGGGGGGSGYYVPAATGVSTIDGYRVGNGALAVQYSTGVPQFYSVSTSDTAHAVDSAFVPLHTYAASTADSSSATDTLATHINHVRALGDSASAVATWRIYNPIVKLSGESDLFFNVWSDDMEVGTPLNAWTKDKTQGADLKFKVRGSLNVPPLPTLPPEPFNWRIVTTADAHVGATSVAVESVGVPIPSGAHLYGPTNTGFILSAPVNWNETLVTVYPLEMDIPSGTVLTGTAPAPPTPPPGSPPAAPWPGTEESTFVGARRLTVVMPPPTLNAEGQPI
jgi:hypothetical protein